MSRESKFIFFFVAVAASYILSSSYLGLYGHHVWRQADVYSQVLGFLGLRGLQPYSLFVQDLKAVFDIPIYQYILATLSKVFRADPLVVTRFFNILLWGLTAFSGFKIAILWGYRSAGVFFLALFSTSPLILHYYSVPLPDLMSLALSLYAVSVLFSDRNYTAYVFALIVLVVATLIKSPVVAVIFVFYLALAWFSSEKNHKSKIIVPISIGIILTVVSIFAEVMRNRLLTGGYTIGFAQDPVWYFGTLELRASKEFWVMQLSRTNDFCFRKFGFFLVGMLLYSFVTFRLVKANVVALAFFVAYLFGWLVFSNVYYIHDYYQLPLCVLSFLVAAIVLAQIHHSHFCGSSKKKYAFTAFCSLLVLFMLHTLIFHDISDRSRVNRWVAFEYALQKQPVVVLSTSREDGPKRGGLLSTQILRVSPSQFEEQCQNYMQNYTAFLADYASECIKGKKTFAATYVEEGGATFLVLMQPEQQSPLSESLHK